MASGNQAMHHSDVAVQGSRMCGWLIRSLLALPRWRRSGCGPGPSWTQRTATGRLWPLHWRRRLRGLRRHTGRSGCAAGRSTSRATRRCAARDPQGTASSALLPKNSPCHNPKLGGVTEQMLQVSWQCLVAHVSGVQPLIAARLHAYSLVCKAPTHDACLHMQQINGFWCTSCSKTTSNGACHG